MTAQDPALRRALDYLTTQVDPDNVMAVHKVFRQQADELKACLAGVRQSTVVGLCGWDPVSPDAAVAFNGKIDELLRVHKAHQEELDVAAQHLKGIALSYGHTEREIADSLDAEPR